MRFFNPILIISLLILLSGCFRLLGIKQADKVDEKDQRKIEKHIKMPFFKSSIDTIAYNSMVKSIDKSSQEKLFYQPLQFYIYEKEKLLSFGANCLYPGYKLNWDFYHQFDSLKLYIPYSLDTSKIYQNRVFRNFHKTLIESSDFDTIIIVHFTSFLFRHSKRLMGYVNLLDKKIKNKTVHLICMDEVFRDEMNK
jgi:hypothetical protein